MGTCSRLGVKDRARGRLLCRWPFLFLFCLVGPYLALTGSPMPASSRASPRARQHFGQGGVRERAHFLGTAGHGSTASHARPMVAQRSADAETGWHTAHNFKKTALFQEGRDANE